MKYSFIIPYYDRAEQFYFTLMSYRHWYGDRNDVEIIVVEDKANVEDPKKHAALIDVLYAYGDLNWHHHLSEYGGQLNPCRHRNFGAAKAKGQVLCQTNPECFHCVDILKEVDGLLHKHVIQHAVEVKDGSLPKGFGPAHPLWRVPSLRNKYLAKNMVNKEVRVGYIVCACENDSYDKTKKSFSDFSSSLKRKSWYQHSAHNNRQLHWCAFLTKAEYEEIGGFDEAFGDLCGYDDNDFINTVKKNNIGIICRDDLLVAHLDHPTDHQFQKGNLEKAKAALTLFKKKWPFSPMILFRET